MYPVCRRLPNEPIAIDAAITQSLAQALGKRLAAADRSSGNGHAGRDLQASATDVRACASFGSITSTSSCTAAALLCSAACSFGQLHFVDLLDAARAQFHRHAHEQAVDAVLAFEIAAQGRTFFLSFRIDSAISTAAADGA